MNKFNSFSYSRTDLLKLYRFLKRFTRINESHITFSLAIVIGILAGVAAYILRITITLIDYFFFNPQSWGYDVLNFLGEYRIIFVPAIGALLMWPITRYLAPEVAGGGVGKVLYSLKRRSGFIRARVIPLKIIATSFIIGSGGSAGPEGPVVQIGASVGSFISQILKFPAEKTKLFVACGTAAGLAATFNAPMAGVFFALEILLGSFRTQSFGLVAVSSAAGAIVARIIVGDTPVFSIPIQYNIAQYHELWIFLLMGIGCALVGRGFSKMLLFTENQVEKLKVPSWIKLGAGGLLVGLIGFKFPGAIGIGYEHGTDVVKHCLDASITIRLLLIILVLKITATSITLGSGGSGGTLAPILVLGALTGGVFGQLAELYFRVILHLLGLTLLWQWVECSGLLHLHLSPEFLSFSK